jgi:hypothetical protein
MKKLIPGLILAAVSCSSAFAAESSIALNSGSATAVPADDTGCLILASGVNIGLSANVQGAVYCAQADGTNPSMIMVGTCHTGGLTKSRDIQCTREIDPASADPANPDYFYAPSICTDSNFPVGESATNVTVTGPSMFSGNTATGGGIAEHNMNEVCSGANVLTDVTALAAQ